MRLPWLLGALPLLAACTHTVHGTGGSPNDDVPPPATTVPSPTPKPGPPEEPAPVPTPPEWGEASSTDYQVSQMTASMSATSNGTEVRVVAALLVESGTKHVRLEGDDVLTARIGDNGYQVALTPVIADGPKDLRYAATLPLQPSSSTKIIVAFLRAPGLPNAGYSTVTLASPFEITKAPSTLAPGTPAKVSLSNAGPTQIDVVGDCINGPQNRIMIASHANGMDDIAIDTTKIVLTPTMTSCNAFLDVRRTSRGTVDSAFARGLFNGIGGMEGVQDRSVLVHVTK